MQNIFKVLATKFYQWAFRINKQNKNKIKKEKKQNGTQQKQ